MMFGCLKTINLATHELQGFYMSGLLTFPVVLSSNVTQLYLSLWYFSTHSRRIIGERHGIMGHHGTQGERDMSVLHNMLG